MTPLAPPGPITYPPASAGVWTGLSAVHEPAPEGPPKPRLLDRVREAVRARHYSRRTEKAYAAWTRRYVLFHDKRHPADMGAPEVTRFLTSLAVDRQVAASTQNQALSALLFLYREVLGLDLPWLDDIVRAKRPNYLPVVLTRQEVRALLERLDGAPKLMALLMYGPGLRLLECAPESVGAFLNSRVLARIPGYTGLAKWDMRGASRFQIDTRLDDEREPSDERSRPLWNDRQAR